MMSEDTLIEAIMMTRSQVDFLWQFFVTAHIAVFALVFIYDEAIDKLNGIARAMSLAGVGLFEWINGNALINTYLLLDAMMDQYRAAFGAAERFRPAFYERFVLSSFSDRPEMVYLTHGLALTVVVMAILSRTFIQARRRARQG
jgi:hypothetical protein